MSTFDPPPPPPPPPGSGSDGGTPPPPPPPPPPYGGGPGGSAPPPPPPPPPGGEYGAPADGAGYGGYGGYGTPPPAPGGYGMPGAPMPNPGWSLGDAFSFGFKAFGANAGPAIGAAALGLVLTFVLGGLGYVVQSALGRGLVASFAGNGIQIAVSTLVTAVLAGQFARAALPVADGGRFEFSRFADLSDLGGVIVVGLLVAAITFVGTLLCILPGIAASYLLSYSIYFVVDQRMAPGDAIQASFAFCRANLGSTLVWWILSSIFTLIGLCLCGVGYLVTAPVALFGTVYTYRKLHGRPVVQPA